MSAPQQIGNLAANFLQLNGLMNKAPQQQQETAEQNDTFVHPILAPKDFKESIAKYNQFIQKYNMKVWMENAEIRDYNKEVIRHRRKASITAEQKVKELLWKESHKDHTPEAYNEAVEKYNEENGPQIRKKNFRQEVKPESEKYFVAFLHQYNMQLFKRSRMRASLDVHVPGELPKLELYPNKIVESEREGCKNLPVSVETVRHHRERLEEAGVLTGYSYHGPNRPIKIAFNPAVLFLTDNGKSKKAATGNQRLSPSQTNKVQHNNVSSSNILLEENKNRDKGEAATASSHHNCTGTSTGAPNRQGGKKTKAPAENPGTTEKNSPGRGEKNELSTLLASNIDDRTDLVQDLAQGKHKNHRPIAQKAAQQEAFYGAMHPDDFKELAIQDIFKFSASLFADLDVHPGSWMNAYKIWMKEKFQSFTGHTLSKPNLLEKWQKSILVLREVKKFKKKHTSWQPQFPSLYFDPARSFKENNSFEYAFRFFRLDEGKVESLQKRKNKAQKSLRTKTDVKKAQEYIRRMISGKISLDQLFSLVQQNCNREVNDNLKDLLKKEFNKINNA